MSEVADSQVFVMSDMIRPFIASAIAAGTAATGGLIENHTMDLKTVCAVGGIVLGGAWMLSHRFTRIEDRLDEHTKIFQNLWCMREKPDRECEEAPKKDKT